MKKISKVISRIIALLERFCDRPWYLPAIGFIAAADLFVCVVPTEGLLISSVILQPRRWIRTFVWMSVGSAIGATALGYVSHHYGETVVRFISEGALASASWMKTQAFLDKYGAVAVGLIAFSPIPLQPAIILAGLAKMPIYHLLISVLLARGLKFGIYAWVATHAPHLLRKFKLARRETEEIMDPANMRTPPRWAESDANRLPAGPRE
jgi:membrane protein YqaA with SNARE-associated domain